MVGKIQDGNMLTAIHINVLAGPVVTIAVIAIILIVMEGVLLVIGGIGGGIILSLLEICALIKLLILDA
jgi:hypothetical protein